jgi:hypothetical protein
MSLFDPRIRLDPRLYEQVRKVAERAGYSSAEEFVVHLLEKAVADAEQSEGEADIRKRLQGLGYLDSP